MYSLGACAKPAPGVSGETGPDVRSRPKYRDSASRSSELDRSRISWPWAGPAPHGPPIFRPLSCRFRLPMFRAAQFSDIGVCSRPESSTSQGSAPPPRCVTAARGAEQPASVPRCMEVCCGEGRWSEACYKSAVGPLLRFPSRVHLGGFPLGVSSVPSTAAASAAKSGAFVVCFENLVDHGPPCSPFGRIDAEKLSGMHREKLFGNVRVISLPLCYNTRGPVSPTPHGGAQDVTFSAHPKPFATCFRSGACAEVSKAADASVTGCESATFGMPASARQPHNHSRPTPLHRAGTRLASRCGGHKSV